MRKFPTIYDFDVLENMLDEWDGRAERQWQHRRAITERRSFTAALGAIVIAGTAIFFASGLAKAPELNNVPSFVDSVPTDSVTPTPPATEVGP